MAQEIREKRANEKYEVGLDFKHELGSDTIASVESTVDTGLTKDGSPTYSGTFAYQLVSGGTAGNYYLVTLKITTAGGRIFERPAIVRVVADAKPRTVQAAIALIDLAEAKNYLTKATDEDDAVIEMLINAVSSAFNSFTNRTLAKTAFSNSLLDGNGERFLYLPEWPIVTLSGIYEDDILLVEGATSDYLIYDSLNNPYLHKVNGLWSRGNKNIKLSTFEAGYNCLSGTITLPDDLRLAALRQLGEEFTRYQNKDWGMTSITYPTGSVAKLETGLLTETKRVLWRYIKLR